jgi:two-component system, OmpR family, response regulator
VTHHDTKTIRVLHVEDDPDILEISKLALVDVGGLVVLQFSSGSRALSEAVSFQPDLLLLDVMMPEMSGIELLGALRALPGLETTPAVFMTARAQNSETAELRAIGASGVVVKPFDPMTLADRLRDIVDHPA